MQRPPREAGGVGCAFSFLGGEVRRSFFIFTPQARLPSRKSSPTLARLNRLRFGDNLQGRRAAQPSPDASVSLLHLGPPFRSQPRREDAEFRGNGNQIVDGEH